MSLRLRIAERRRPFALSAVALAALFAAACGGENPGACEEGFNCDPQLRSLRLTYLEVRYDLEQPVYINNRVPITYGLTAEGIEPGATQQVAVTFSFIEADPVDPEVPIECSSSASVVEVIGDGVEHRFNGYVWPTTVCEELVGREVNLRVEFDGGEEIDNGIDSPAVVLTAAARGEALNQLCLSPSGEAGCVYSFDLQPTPSDASGTLIDVRHASMTTDSSVAVLEATLEAGAEPRPSLAVQSSLVVNGRDPYVAATAPEDVPAGLEEAEPGITEELLFGLDPSQIGDLIALPGGARIRYDIRPVGSSDAYLPLRVGVPDSETGERVDAAPVTELLPGTANQLSHELFAEGETRTALEEGGAWGAMSDFEVRGCFEADFTQAGNEGEIDYADDCQTIEVVLVRGDAAAGAATAHQFNAELGRSVGGDRLGLEVGLETENRLDNTGVSSRVEGFATLRGNIGRSFGIDIARARALAGAGVDPAANGYEVTVDAFANRVYEIGETGGEIVREEDFSVARSFDFPNLGFGFGPVRIGITVGVGGEVGITTADRLYATTDGATCTDIVDPGRTFVGCGGISRTTTPYFAFTANIFGGVSIGPVSGGVEAELRILNTSFPLITALDFGVDDGGAVLVRGNANWGLELTLIDGSVYIVGRVRFRGRFLRRFNRTLRVHLFSFSSPLIRHDLLDRDLALEVLE